MNDLLVFAAHNTVVALVFALLVCALTRVWRNPPVAHVLWLLVLIKLVAPPILHVQWLAFRLPEAMHPSGAIIADVPQIESWNADSEAHVADWPTAPATSEAPAISVDKPDFADSVRDIWDHARPVLFWSWLSGTALCAAVAAARIVRFERRLRETLPASERLLRLTLEIAGKLGVRRAPDLRYADFALVPLLWCAGRRATILLPTRLLHQLDDAQVALILAHELAHLRRRDHWVRFVELIVSTVYWWNPLVWAVRRQIHQAEDLCCDAWVRWAFPDCAKQYAQVLLKTAESLGAPEVGARLLPASPFLGSFSLKARIEMILENRFARSVSKRSLLVIALLALLLSSSLVEAPRTEAFEGAKDDAKVVPCDTSFLAKSFKYQVPFELGQTQRQAGGQIEIREIWGTRPRIEIGGQYLVRGKYVLPPAQRGKLYFYATAGGPWGQTASLDLQSTVLDKQEGEFALVHGMAGPGSFHLILTAEESYSQWFANVYFGNPEKVTRTDEAAAKSGTSTSSEFTSAVKFEQGATRFLNSDKIEIVEIRGTSDTFSPGNIYRIKGKYSLASHDRATLAAYTTAMDRENAKSATMKVQATVVNRGDGTFTLFLPMAYRGWPHVSFYPTDGGDGFGGNYFGTGDTVLKQW